MKEKTLHWLLGVEAALCLLLGLFPVTGQWMVQAAGLPLGPLAELMRAMSLAGVWGNALAMLLYGALCLLPLWYFFYLEKKDKMIYEDWLLPVMSVALFFILRRLVNPQEELLLNSGMEAAMYGYGFWSLTAAWLVLRFLHLARDNADGRTWDYLRRLLTAVAFLFVYAGFTPAAEGERGFFFWLDYAVGALPWVMDLWILLEARKLMSCLKSDPYAEETVDVAHDFSAVCARALSAIVLTNALYNLFQLLCRKWMTDVNIQLSVPLFSILFVLAALLFARLLEDNRKLKQDNDLFI